MGLATVSESMQVFDLGDRLVVLAHPAVDAGDFGDHLLEGADHVEHHALAQRLAVLVQVGGEVVELSRYRAEMRREACVLPSAGQSSGPEECQSRC